MTSYRFPPLQPRLAPPAPWWRLLRAKVSGTFSRLETAQRARQVELLRRDWAAYHASLEAFDRRLCNWRDVHAVAVALWSHGLTSDEVATAPEGPLRPPPPRLPPPVRR